MNSFYQHFFELTQSDTPFVSVTLVDSVGSIPQEPGAKMLVTKKGLYYGTVGGGKIENRALEEAIKLLNDPDKKQSLFFNWNLNKDIGMTCGGSVKLYFEVFNQPHWKIVVFGAGHIANAMIPLLLNLDCQITCIDPRQEWLDKLPEHFKLTKIKTDDMPAEVEKLSNDSFLTLVTMGHTTDKPILLEILKTKKFPYVGVIGSRAKAIQLEKDIEEAGLPESSKDAFYCPMGLDIGNNHPQEIAISIVAQLLEKRDSLCEIR